jgi:hypothetical protein
MKKMILLLLILSSTPTIFSSSFDDERPPETPEEKKDMLNYIVQNLASRMDIVASWEWVEGTGYVLFLPKTEETIKLEAIENLKKMINLLGDVTWFTIKQ